MSLATLWNQVCQYPKLGAMLEPKKPGDGRLWYMNLGTIRVGPGDAEEVVREALTIVREKGEEACRKPQARCIACGSLRPDVCRLLGHTYPIKPATSPTLMKALDTLLAPLGNVPSPSLDWRESARRRHLQLKMKGGYHG